MKVTQIVVNAGRTFNHPFESYSNLRPAVTLTAALDDGDDVKTAVRMLQAEAEELVEDHKQHMLTSLEQLENTRLREREMAHLSDLIKSSQSRLDALRNGENVPLQLGPARSNGDWK